MTGARLLESVARVGPLGVRFWDFAEERFVADGLIVRVGLASGGSRITATAGESGIFTARGLPGLNVIEFGDTAAGYWSTTTTKSYVVEVHDPAGRFLPFSFPARLPARGLFVWTCALSPPSSGLSDGVPLFLAPSRPAASMRGVIRAQLQDAATGGDAAGAVLVATIAGSATVTGIADARGRVAIVMPYPEPSDFPIIGSSPPVVPVGSSLAAYSWPVTLAAQYGRITPYPPYPDLCTTLRQPGATLLGDASGSPLPTQTLRMGVELVVRSVDVATGSALPVLLVRAP